MGESRVSSFTYKRALLSCDLTQRNVTRIRGFSLELLRALLQSNPRTTAELSELFEKKQNYMRTYLYRLKRYGLVEKHFNCWYLTDRGRSLAQRLESLLEKHESSHSSSRSLSVDSALRLLEKYNLSPSARALALKLIENYMKSGLRRKYVVLTSSRQLEDELEMSADDFRSALAELESKGIAYRLVIKGYGLKVGLLDGFVRELLDHVD
ncbi:MAG: hypothetical protein QW196_08275 [Sulfolobales archaeon]